MSFFHFISLRFKAASDGKAVSIKSDSSLRSASPRSCHRWVAPGTAVRDQACDPPLGLALAGTVAEEEINQVIEFRKVLASPCF